MAAPTSILLRCPVCWGGMRHGQATFTAECSHTFHLRCAPASALCPVCGAHWRDTPAPADPTATYDDDEPVEPPPPHAPLPSAEATGAGSLLVLKTHCEYPALSKAAARDGFAVLVHAKAPSAAADAASANARAPVDLVTVLDVSASMEGEKISLVKRAMGFVIDNLGAGDRLSVVAFHTGAVRVLRLTRMTADGKAAAKRAVEALAASGSTNIRGGLDEAAKVLEDRRHRNAVASVILLSDGQDNQSFGFSNGHGSFRTPDYDLLVPPSFSIAGGRCAAVHAFGFGTDHDAAAMHAISEITGGTFSFVEDHAAIQDAFARCVGGLLSVAAQEARVAVECLHPGVRRRPRRHGRRRRAVLRRRAPVPSLPRRAEIHIHR
ncbi:unnamed protein product [Urochloa humidicola]